MIIVYILYILSLIGCIYNAHKHKSYSWLLISFIPGFNSVAFIWDFIIYKIILR